MIFIINGLKKSLLLVIFIILIITGIITGCSRQQKTIQIGYNSWIGYEAIIIAEKNNFFKNENVNVELHHFSSLYDVMRAFADGKIDMMFSTTNEAILLADKGHKLKIILVTDYSYGADNIVAQKNIKSIKNLKGKKVGVEVGSISHFTLLKALKKAGLSENDIQLVNVSSQEALVKFTEHSLDAIATWSPFTYDAIKSGGHIIFSSREVPGEIIDIVSARSSLINDYPNECLKIITAYLKTLDWFDKNLNEGLNIISKSYKIDPSIIAEDLKNVQLLNAQENLTAFGTPQSKGSLYPATQKLISFLYQHEFISQNLNANDLIDPNFVWDYKNKYDEHYSR